MSKNLEEIKRLMIPTPQELRDIQTRQQEMLTSATNQKNKEQEKLDKINRSREILKNSGVKQIFEEIRDSGLVKENEGPVVKDMPVYKNKLFQGKVVDHYEKIQISPYTPAIVKEFTEQIYHDYIDEKVVGIRISYNGWWERVSNDVDEQHGCAIEIVVINEKLNLVEKNEKNKFENTYTPIEDGQLLATIAKALKSAPLSW